MATRKKTHITRKTTKIEKVKHRKRKTRQKRGTVYVVMTKVMIDSEISSSRGS